MDERPTRPGLAPWFSDEDRSAVADFWSIFERHHREVWEANSRAVRVQPEFAPVMRDVSEEMLGDQEKRSFAALQQAFERGDWAPYQDFLRQQARTYIERGLDFAGWHHVGRSLADGLAVRLVDAFASSPARLQASLRAMRHFVDRAVVFMGSEYIAASEAALRDSERGLATTLDSIADGVVTAGCDGRVTGMNPVAERLTGWSRAEARGRLIDDLFEIVEGPRLAPQGTISHALRTGATVRFGKDAVLVARSGKELPIAGSCAPIRGDGGAVGGVVTVFRDMSSEREAERALRESEARKAAILEAALDCIVTLDGAGRIVEFNPAAERAFGLSRAQAIGSQFGDLLPACEGAAHYERLSRMLTRGTPGTADRVQITALRATGEEFPVEVAVVRIPTAGEPMFTGYLRDLTDAKRAEEQLEARRLEAEASARALSSSERQLRALAARVQSASEEERTRIAREIHDELGQHLTALNMDIAWLIRRMGDASERERLTERLQAMSALIESTIQTVRRIATELRPGVLDDLGLKDAVEWQAQEFQARSGIEVQVLAPDEPLDVGAENATALFRCFQEVLTNAARHSRAKKIEVRLQSCDGAVVLEVKDDGRGITRDEATRPTSLGLLGMRERAALLGGTFSIEGSTSGGTTVTIRIPAGAPAHETSR